MGAPFLFASIIASPTYSPGFPFRLSRFMLFDESLACKYKYNYLTVCELAVTEHGITGHILFIANIIK